MILLPGLACDAALWRDQVPALQAAGHEVRVADVHTRFDTLPAMAAAVLREQGGPLRLAGSSMGGMLALEVLAQAPGRVAAVALLGTTARADTPEMLRLRTEAIALFEQGRADEVILANVPFAVPAGLAEMDVHIDQPRGNNLPGSVDHRFLAGWRRVIGRNAGWAVAIPANQASVSQRPSNRQR